MINITDKYKKLVELLYRKTANGSVVWKSDPLLIYTIIAGRSIFIDEVQNSNFEECVEIDIRYGEGEGERFTDETLKGEPEIHGYKSYYELMKDIRVMAVRQTTRADENIDAILSELDDDVPF